MQWTSKQDIWTIIAPSDELLTERGWERKFAWLPQAMTQQTASGGTQWVWLTWYWRRFAGSWDVGGYGGRDWEKKVTLDLAD